MLALTLGLTLGLVALITPGLLIYRIAGNVAQHPSQLLLRLGLLHSKRLR